MNHMGCPKTEFSRRGFMIGIAGLTFAVAVGRERFGRAATEAPDVSGTPFNPWVSIATDGEISIMAPATEMGNGSLTSLPVILAEELDADWSKVVAVPSYGRPKPPRRCSSAYRCRRRRRSPKAVLSRLRSQSASS